MDLQRWLCGGRGRGLPLQKGCYPRGWERKQVHCGVNKGLQAHQRASARQLMVVHLLNKCSRAAPLPCPACCRPKARLPILPCAERQYQQSTWQEAKQLQRLCC